jgi:hypothetical protein
MATANERGRTDSAAAEARDFKRASSAVADFARSSFGAPWRCVRETRVACASMRPFAIAFDAAQSATNASSIVALSSVIPESATDASVVLPASSMGTHRKMHSFAPAQVLFCCRHPTALEPELIPIIMAFVQSVMHEAGLS